YKQALLDRAKASLGPQAWTTFQARVGSLRLQRGRVGEELAEAQAQLEDRGRQDDSLNREARPMPPSGAVRAVLVVGFESFNAALYRAAGERLLHLQPPVQLSVFSDRDLDAGKAELAAALKEADVFFGSLLFDFDQVEWLKARIEHIPIRLVFESALELMSSTQMGGESKSKGPPPAVQKVLKLFGSKREEDKLVGYLSFLKIGPKLLKFLPGKRGVKEGVQGSGMFPDAARYMAWYRRTHPGAAAAPVVAVLLYRKHVVTRQPYLWDLVTALEAGGLLPLPIFINGVEAHVIVRDALTSAHEAALVAAHGRGAASPTLARDAVAVDAIVNTVGFPLVGGPAGTMEGGRQAEVARSILATKNVPYLVAAPLLIQEGYDLGGVDLEALDGEAIVSALRQAAEGLRVARGPAGMRDLEAGLPAGVSISAAEVPPSELKRMLEFPADWGPSEWGPIPFLPDRDTLVRRMEKHWGPLDSYRGIASSSAGGLVITGVQIGKVWIGIQPMLGIEGDPMRLLFDRDLTPHPQYAAFYLWLQGAHGAHAVLHFGMHGTAEWLPGSPLGSSALSWPDVLHGDMPNIYLYAANNPSESLVAKRRGFATVISHNVPPYGRAGLYKQLAELRELLADYREAPGSSKDMRGTIVSLVVASGLDEDVVLEQDGVTFDADIVGDLSLEAFNSFTFRLTQYLQLLEGRLFSSGLHVLGKPPSREESLEYLAAYFGDRVPREALERVAAGESVQNVHVGGAAHPEAPSLLEEAQSIASLLGQNGEELRGLTRALSGQWVQPAPGGDLLRDGPGVLPTGRNIFALDPYRMPSPAALLRGSRAAESILAAHREQNDSAFPETVAVNLWGLDAIKTKGESVAIVLHLVGARPVKEGTGRIARFELIPLEGKADALMWLGRPRIDVLCNMSGIFRDSFQNVVELLDDMFHVLARSWATPGPRAMPSATGAGGERGRARPEVLDSLLSTTDRVVQTVDSVEYGLTDIQEYYANTGALRAAAETARRRRGREGVGRVGCSVVEATGREDTPPRELEEVLRLEYRSKLLNPRWAQAMAAQGSGGAFEISQRMTALLGWGATTRFAPGWAWDQAAETYALDPDMADRLREANPEAFRNLLRRCLEAAGRGLWTPGEGVLEGLQQLDADMDAELEGLVDASSHAAVPEERQCVRAASSSHRWPDSPFHLMRVRGLPTWANEGSLGIKLSEVVAGPMRTVLISNYMLDFAWLLSACPDLARAERLIIVHGEGQDKAAAVAREVREAGLASKTTIHQPPLPIPYGTHHRQEEERAGKAFVILFERGVRVVVHTANLIYPDCNNKTQALYTQDFPPAPDATASPFQESLLGYLARLRIPASAYEPLRRALQRHNFSCARAALVASVPGYHQMGVWVDVAVCLSTGFLLAYSLHLGACRASPPLLHIPMISAAGDPPWGHLSLRRELARETAFQCAHASTPFLAQFSSLGSVDASWVDAELAGSAGAGAWRGEGGGTGGMRAPPGIATLVWPTVSEVQNSLEGWLAGRSVPGPASNVCKPFLERYWHRWGGQPVGRQRAMPHIKTYCRFDAATGEVPWYLTASHNLSKAAWGVLQKKGTQLMVRSYELGALHLPSLEAAYLASQWRGYDAVTGACTEQPMPGADPERLRFVAWKRGGAYTPSEDAEECIRYKKPEDTAWAVDYPWPGLDHFGCTVEAPYGAFYGLTEDMEWADLGRRP
ncbi:hypothetical protein APUTEX25_000502, partial [Auxenochlorella protothecoides]